MHLYYIMPIQFNFNFGIPREFNCVPKTIQWYYICETNISSLCLKQVGFEKRDSKQYFKTTTIKYILFGLSW
jgi:hypothetical protein